MAKATQSQVYVRDIPVTVTKIVKFNELIKQEDVFQYRNPDDLDKNEEGMKKLISEIAQTKGNLVPMLVDEGTGNQQGKYVVIDGHRRMAAIQQNIDTKIEGFSLDMEVKVDVVTNEVKEVDLILQAAALNTTQQTWGDFGRLALVKALHEKYFLSDAVISSTTNMSDSTTKRDLLIVKTNWAFDHFKKGFIKYSHLSNILEAASKGKVEDSKLKAKFDSLLEQFKQDHVADCEKKLELNKTTEDLKVFTAKKFSSICSSWTKALASGQVEKQAEGSGFQCEILKDEKTNLKKLKMSSFEKTLFGLSGDQLAAIADQLKVASEEVTKQAAIVISQEEAKDSEENVKKVQARIAAIKAKKEADKGLNDDPKTAATDKLTGTEADAEADGDDAQVDGEGTDTK